MFASGIIESLQLTFNRDLAELAGARNHPHSLKRTWRSHSTSQANEGSDIVGFEFYIGIDYSGADTATARLANLQVYAAEGNKEPQAVRTPAAPPGQNWNWTRQELANWLLGILRDQRQAIVGIDHAHSFPMSYLQRHKLTSWDEFLVHFCQQWPTHQPNIRVRDLRQDNSRHGESDEFRLTETWTSSAKSVFDFDPNGVAFSTHAGIPWLQHIRREAGKRIHFWPFDGWEVVQGKSVIVEIYPAIFHNRYPRLGSGIERTSDQQDAYSVARWLCESDRRGLLPRYFDPPLTDAEQKVASLEGWILGIA